ncbi:MAG: DoxX family protein [Gammaproteobacteria bacterium]|nr:DoxX family protein [Gammaproteobacteria bacterium]
MNSIQQLSTPVGRLLLSFIFIMSGLAKIGGGYAATQGYMESVGISGSLLPLVILVEIAAGSAVLVGWKTRWAALALAGFSIVSGILFHSNFNDQTQMIMFMKNISMAGGLLILVSLGAGSYSFDNRQKTNS